MEPQPTQESESTGEIKIGATRHCCYGVCKSDSRYADRDYMKDVRWLPFPKPKGDIDKCQRWITACGRPGFTVDKVKKWTYICTKHFIGGKGPTTEYPDPVPASLTEEQLKKMRGKCKTAKERNRKATQSSHVKQIKEVIHAQNKFGPSHVQLHGQPPKRSLLESCSTFQVRLDMKEKEDLLCNVESTFELHPKSLKTLPTKEKSFQCKICYKILSAKSSLNRHLKLHSGLKEFKCHLCSKEFSEKSNLNTHIRMHTSQMNFKCHLCDKEFILKDIFQAHLKTHDAQSEFKCKFCLKEFQDKWQMKEHVAAHLKTTGVKGLLKQHLLAHPRFKKFSCYICNDEFSSESYLQQHILEHNVQMIVVQNSSSSNEAVNMTELEADPDVDPLLIEEEKPLVVKEDIPDLALSGEASSMFSGTCCKINKSSVKVENDVDNEVYWKNICDAGEALGDFVKVEEFPDYDHEVT